MGQSERRRSPRASVWLRATLRYGASEEKAFAGEVGLRGAFVVTMTPRPVRQLLGLSLALPEGEPLEVNGMVARSVRPDEAARLGVPPGMGIQFYGLSRPARERWEGVFFRILTGRIKRTSPPPTTDAGRGGGAPSLLIVDGLEPEAGSPARGGPTARAVEPIVPLTRVKRRAGPGAEEPALEPPTVPDRAEGHLASWYQYFLGEAGASASARPGPDTSGREGPRPREASAPDEPEGPVLYRLALPGIGALQRLGATALAARGIFLRNVEPRPPGTPAVLCVVHPLSGEELHLPGEVVSVDTDREGVAVALGGLTSHDLEGFGRFVAEGRAGSSPRAADEGPTLSHAPPRIFGADAHRPEGAQDVGLSGLMVLTAAGRAPGGDGEADDVDELSVSDLELVED